MIKTPNAIKIVSTALFSLLVFLTCTAQQTPAFAEYNYNPFLLNSAYAGMQANTEITISNAGLFSSFDGSPKSLAATINSPFNRGKVGLGAGLILDEIGVTKTTSFFAAYSYKIFFDFKSSRPYWQNYNPGVLSFGITAGVQQFQDNLLELGIVGDPSFNENINATIPTIGLGFLFNHALFYIGVSTSNVIGEALASDDNLNLENPYYGYAGYRFFNNRFEELMIKPNVLIKYEKGAPLQVDMNLAVSIRNKFEIGAGYRTTSSVNVLAGIYLFESLRFIYNYNVALNDSPIGNTQGFALSFQLNGYKTN